MSGSATLTTEPSRNARPEPSTVVATTHRARGSPQTRASSGGGAAEAGSVTVAPGLGGRPFVAADAAEPDDARAGRGARSARGQRVAQAVEARRGVAAEERRAHRGIERVETGSVQLDGIGVALEVRVVRREHAH